MTSPGTPIRPARIILLGITLLALAGCAKKSGQAVVLEKEYIAAAEIRAEPSPATDEAVVSPTPASDSGATDEPVTTRELRPDEIVVDTYVMKKDVRGTSKDPRALAHESWLVRVKLISSGRKITVPADRKQYEKLKPGDRVEVRYREGKYTGTVWSAEIQ